jgi:hypothetical protein
VRAPRPRSKEGTHPHRVSLERNVITPSPSGPAGKPTVREAQPDGGEEMSQEANASSRKAAGMHNRLDRSLTDSKGC